MTNPSPTMKNKTSYDLETQHNIVILQKSIYEKPIIINLMEMTTSQHDKLSFLIATALMEGGFIKSHVRYVSLKVSVMMTSMTGGNIIEALQNMNFVEQGKFGEARTVVANIIFKQSEIVL